MSSVHGRHTSLHRCSSHWHIDVNLHVVVSMWIYCLRSLPILCYRAASAMPTAAACSFGYSQMLARQNWSFESRASLSKLSANDMDLKSSLRPFVLLRPSAILAYCSTQASKLTMWTLKSCFQCRQHLLFPSPPTTPSYPKPQYTLGSLCVCAVATRLVQRRPSKSSTINYRAISAWTVLTKSEQRYWHGQQWAEKYRLKAYVRADGQQFQHLSWACHKTEKVVDK